MIIQVKQNFKKRSQKSVLSYEEDQLTLINDDVVVGKAIIEKYEYGE